MVKVTTEDQVSTLAGKLLEIDGVSQETLPGVWEKVLCRNFEKCGNQAEEDHAYCTDCYFKWRKEQVEQKDCETKLLRVNVQERLEKARGFYVRYYKREDSEGWPKEVRKAFLAAEAAIAEGDRRVLEAVNENNPNPGLFRVVRFHYFNACNHLAVARYHSARISAKGILKGLPDSVQRQLRDAMRKAKGEMREVDKLKGYKKTRQLQNAARAMCDVLSAARKERLSPNEGDAESSCGEGAVIGDFLSDDQVRKLNHQHRRRQDKTRKR
jgi:hypothetical protein